MSLKVCRANGMRNNATLIRPTVQIPTLTHHTFGFEKKLTFYVDFWFICERGFGRQYSFFFDNLKLI